MNLEYIQAILPALLKGTWQTLQVFFPDAGLITAFGSPFALGSISRFFPVRFLSKAYIWVFRGTPLMLQLFFVYYGLPIMFGPAFRMENTVAAVLTFTMNYAAYFAEIYRAGVQSIDHGQHEAAKTLGFSRWPNHAHHYHPSDHRPCNSACEQRGHHAHQGYCPSDGNWCGRIAESGQGRQQPGCKSYGIFYCCRDLSGDHLFAHAAFAVV